MITDETIAYLGGFGTEVQQQLFQDASTQIEAVYTAKYPDDLEDMASMIADQLSGAAQYALGDASLESLADTRDHAYRAYLTAQDELRGACVAAIEQGIPKSRVAEVAGVTRRTLDRWTGAD